MGGKAAGKMTAFALQTNPLLFCAHGLLTGMAASAQVGGKAAGKVTGFALRTAAKVATLGQMGKKKEEGAGQTKAEKRQRAVRHG